MSALPEPDTSSVAPSRLLRLARKELTEILRDRRTIATLVVMPLLLYPVLTIAFGQVVFGARAADVTPRYRLGVPTEEQQNHLLKFLGRGVGALRGQQGPAAAPYLSSEVVDDMETAVREGKIDVGCRPSPIAGEWELVYREDDPHARTVVGYVQQLAAAADAEIARDVLRKTGLHPPPAPRFLAAPLPVEERGGQTLAVFVPLVLILMTITGAVYPAIDLTAGERERGTLEVLLAAPVPRVSLLFGKYVAVVTVAVLTALINLGAMNLSLLAADWLYGGVSERVFGTGGLRLLPFVKIFPLVVLFAAFFSAVLLVLTSFARSFKEAQAYLIPLMVVSILPGVLALYPDLGLAGPAAVVPLLNIVLLARDLLAGKAEPISAAAVVISTAAYAVLALALAARVFGAEGVLYGESGGWPSLWRRKPRKAAARSE
jgi:ABC-2 type transport system permease protein/sodium transport system permease protein